MTVPACRSYCGDTSPLTPAPAGGGALIGAAVVEDQATANTGAGFVETTAELDFTLVEAGSVAVVVGGVLAKPGGGGTVSSVGLSVDGAAPTAERISRTHMNGSNLPEAVALVSIIALSAGAHNIRLMFASEAGAATVCGPNSVTGSGLGFTVQRLP